MSKKGENIEVTADRDECEGKILLCRPHKDIREGMMY